MGSGGQNKLVHDYQLDLPVRHSLKMSDHKLAQVLARVRGRVQCPAFWLDVASKNPKIELQLCFLI